MAFVTPTDVATGDVLTATRYNQDVAENMTELAPFFGAWTSWTPEVFQNGARTSTNTQSRYLKIGRLVHAYAIVTITETGSTGNVIACTLPFASAFANDAAMGSFAYFRASGPRSVGSVVSNSAFGASPGVLFHAQATNVVGIDPNFATADGDLLRFSVTYEAAS